MASRPGSDGIASTLEDNLIRQLENMLNPSEVKFDYTDIQAGHEINGAMTNSASGDRWWIYKNKFPEYKLFENHPFTTIPSDIDATDPEIQALCFEVFDSVTQTWSNDTPGEELTTPGDSNKVVRLKRFLNAIPIVRSAYPQWDFMWLINFGGLRGSSDVDVKVAYTGESNVEYRRGFLEIQSASPRGPAFAKITTPGFAHNLSQNGLEAIASGFNNITMKCYEQFLTSLYGQVKIINWRFAQCKRLREEMTQAMMELRINNIKD